MQFVIIAKDHKEDGLARRLSVREDHIKLGDEMRESGKHIFGVATLDENQEMNGSVMVVEFESEEELEKWLATEPYVTGKVWDQIEIIPCKVGPSFLKNS